MNLLKILLFKLNLVRNGVYFLLKTINLLFLNGNVLSIDHNAFLLLVSLLQVRSLNGLLDPLLEVYDFVIDEVLIDLHFLFEVAHLSLVYQL